MFSYNESSQSYQASLIDENCGPANVFHYQEDGYDVIITANREIDEIAMYRLEYRDEEQEGADEDAGTVKNGSI